ncbi:septum formation family protein [Catellatospora sichuanensis]|uniref:septum formation family protein n=1 Tax=Catellatospora sichuanensis TaxID=1969805 RepID=UPI00118390E6|nr:septum formation family protein [Catellatospora sichuanensis]
MRGRLKAGTMLAALLVNVVLAGCAAALPAEVDTDLTDDWATVAEVKVQVPPSGVCLGKSVGTSAGDELPCSEQHFIEVVHVGAFEGEKLPSATQLAAAYAECDTASAKHLGRPWWEGRLELQLTIPKDHVWAGGARWFRCDLFEVGDAGTTGGPTLRSGSLKDGFPAALVLGCVNVAMSEDDVRFMTDVACGKKHNSEWVGFYRAAEGTAYPTSERQWDVLHQQCRVLVGKYLGVSTAQADRLGLISIPRGYERWKAGDRAVRCAMWFETKTMTKSAKGTKGKGVPYF